MFFRKECKECAGHKSEVEQLREELDAARREISGLKSAIEFAPDVTTQKVPSSDAEKAPNQNKLSQGNYYDKTVAWEDVSLQDIEREIKGIYERHGRHPGSIAAVNELQSIQQEIKKRHAASSDQNATKRKIEVERGSKAIGRKKRNPYNKQTAHNAVRVICEKYSSQFRDIVLSSSSDWSADYIVSKDRQNLINFIEQYAPKVSKQAGFSGDAKDFGKLLSNDERAWSRMVQSQIPTLLREEEKVRREEDRRNKNWIALQPMLRDALITHKPQLISNLRKSYVVNEYGTVEKDARNIEIERFLKSVKLLSKANGAGLSKSLGYVKSWATKEISSTTIKTPLPENGLDFEYWVADRLNERSWEAQVTQGSGDQGVDVVANVNGLRLAIQCKLYTGSVGNKAVQEVLAGMSFFDLDRGVIISTGKYTKSAHALANKNQILLLTPNDIPYLSELLQT